MANLSDLLPQGGGQNNTDFVADGNVSAGAPVILTAAGKAKAVGLTSQSESFGTAVDIVGSSVTIQRSDCAFIGNSKFFIVYRNMSDGYFYSVIASISGTTVSFGTPTVILSNIVLRMAVCYDSTADKAVVAYEAHSFASANSLAVVCTVTGTSISLGTPVQFQAGVASMYSITYDPSADRSVINYHAQDTTGYVSCIVGTVSGTSISFGTAVAIVSAGGFDVMGCYDSANNKVVVSYYNSSDSNNGYSAVGTVSGTSISFGTPVAFTSASPGVYIGGATYASNEEKIVISFQDRSDSNYGKAIVGTVSGTSISFGTAATFEADTVNNLSNNGGQTYSALAGKTVISWTDTNDSSKGKYVNATISGTSISFSSAAEFAATATYSALAMDNSGPYALFIYNGASEGEGRILQMAANITNLTSTNLLGIAPEAISDTATGTINTWGSRCESSSLLADSLSLGSPDTTSGNGQKENVSMAYDSNADRTILVYRDGGDSDKLKCIIGTLSGTSTSWGTAVEIVGATAGNRGTAVVYDSNAQRVLIAYTKASDNYAYVRVGQISGTSVTLGTEVAASSSNSYYPELSYDVADQKVLLVFANAGDNYYPYSAACTITAVGNSVAVTTPASVASRNAYDPFGLAYNANDGKHVLDVTNNTSTGYAYVLTMSSGSISVGAEASYSPGFTPRQSICVYDSSAQKIVRAYYSNSSPYPVSAAVASISGTNVTFGTAATAFTTNSGTRFHGTFDSSSNQVAFVSRTNSTNYIETNFGSVSGTTITFGTATSVYSGGTATVNYNIVYDSTDQKLIYAYGGATYDAVVGSFGTTPLTVTSDYYVQTDGTISTTSTSPAQLIGNAIKTNQINIKDYTG